MGICRGFQLANIYFGARLENIENQKEHQVLPIKIPKDSGWLDKALQNSIAGICMHGQGVTQNNIATEYLEYPIFYQDPSETPDKSKTIAKAAAPIYSGAAPMILVQFHPEFYDKSGEKDEIRAYASYEGNLVFWKVLQDSAQAYRNKKNMLLEQKNQKTKM